MDRNVNRSKNAPPRRLRLVVPVVLSVAVLAAAVAAVATSIGCGDDAPSRGRRLDAAPDTPIV